MLFRVNFGRKFTLYHVLVVYCHIFFKFLILNKKVWFLIFTQNAN